MSGLLHCSVTGLLGAINFRTIASLCVCQGLRIIECLALRWSDLDSLDGKLSVERGIVAQQVDDVKSEESRKQLTIAPELIEALKMWRQAAQFSAAKDWKFSSPYQLGRLPWSYDQVYRLYQNAAKGAGIGGFGTHTPLIPLWLRLCRYARRRLAETNAHTDVRTTMRYGDAFTNQAQGQLSC